MTGTTKHYRSGVTYGLVVYWSTLVGAFVVLLGSLSALALGYAAIPVDEQLARVLQGRIVVTNIQGASADGLMLMGLSVAIVSLVPAILVSLPSLWHGGHRLVAVFGAVNALLIAGAAVFAFV